MILKTNILPFQTLSNCCRVIENHRGKTTFVSEIQVSVYHIQIVIA